jgi:single-stranded-DNA-specific exonuclease
MGENRIFAYNGLKVLERAQTPGLRALLRVARSATPLDAEAVSFRLAPRINAAGRIADPQLALDLLIEEDEEKSEYLARELDRLNSERQSLVSAAMREIGKTIPGSPKEKLVIVKSSSWPHGIVGLIAGKLTERSLLPVIAMSNNYDPEVYIASCRSRPGFNVAEFIDHFRDMFIRGGGHSAAGGFSIGSDRLALFEESALSWASEHWREADTLSPLEIDCAISGAECNYTNAAELQKLAPFGIGNPEPVFVLQGAQVESVRLLGEQRQHRQMRVRAPDQNILDTITFHIGSDAQTFKKGEVISLAGSLRVNTYGGQKRAQLVLHDTQKSGATE